MQHKDGASLGVFKCVQKRESLVEVGRDGGAARPALFYTNVPNIRHCRCFAPCRVRLSTSSAPPTRWCQYRLMGLFSTQTLLTARCPSRLLHRRLFAAPSRLLHRRLFAAPRRLFVDNVAEEASFCCIMHTCVCNFY